jgi:hypothetical protein
MVLLREPLQTKVSPGARQAMPFASVTGSSEADEIRRAPLVVIANAVKDARQDRDRGLNKEPQRAGAAGHLVDVHTHMRDARSRVDVG